MSFDHISYLSLSIYHFNLAYLDLCKFTLFGKPLQHGLVIIIIFIIIDCELCDEFYEGDCWEHENLYPIGDNEGPSSSRYVFII